VGTPKRARVAVVITGLSKLDRVAIPEALSKFWAWPPAQTERGRASPGEVGSRHRSNMESKTQLHSERQAAATRLALAVLLRSRLAVVVTELSKLDGIARMEAPAKFLA